MEPPGASCVYTQVVRTQRVRWHHPQHSTVWECWSHSEKVSMLWGTLRKRHFYNPNIIRITLSCSSYPCFGGRRYTTIKLQGLRKEASVFVNWSCITQTCRCVSRSVYILGFLLEGSHWIPRFWARLCDNTCATAIGRPYCFSELKVCGKHLRECTKLVIISSSSPCNISVP